MRIHDLATGNIVLIKDKLYKVINHNANLKSPAIFERNDILNFVPLADKEKINRCSELLTMYKRHTYSHIILQELLEGIFFNCYIPSRNDNLYNSTVFSVNNIDMFFYSHSLSEMNDKQLHEYLDYLNERNIFISKSKLSKVI